jgi:hypothetical protein
MLVALDFACSDEKNGCNRVFIKPKIFAEGQDGRHRTFHQEIFITKRSVQRVKG